MRLIQILLIVTVAAIFITQAAPDWYSLGLTDRTVHCILADDTSTIIAGTDSGVSVNFNKEWYHIRMLPVTAIVRVSPTAVAIAAGNGTKSADGIYIGRAIINGPPFYSFTFSLSNYMTAPTALTAEPIISGPATVLYAGNGNSIVSWVVTNDSLKTHTTIGIPKWAFGVEMPYCSGLLMFSGRLYAGGYDRSPVPGSSVLLCSSADISGDSMFSIRQMKTTAIAEGRFLSTLGSGSLVMAVADADSGVFFYDLSMGNPWRRIAGPAGNSIRSLYVWLASPSVNDNVLYAATKDGVFKGTPNVLLAFWFKLGTLPAEPLYITGMGSTGDLLAATTMGVYRYGNQGTGVSAVPRIVSGKYTQGKKIVRASVKNSLTTANGRYNLQGRSIVSKACAGAKASGAVVTDER